MILDMLMIYLFSTLNLPAWVLVAIVIDIILRCLITGVKIAIKSGGE